MVEKPSKAKSDSAEKTTFLLILCCFVLIVSFLLTFLPFLSSPISR
ncbi:MAG: hypothetical protein WCV93_05110 [Candidatus Shapirobacteria bacterium]